MMRVSYKTRDERMQITFEAAGVIDAVVVLAEIQDILENTRCQACVDAGRDGAHGTVLNRRVVEGYTFYAAKCLDPECKAELALSQRKEESGGGLYTKRRQGRKDPNPGAGIEHDGWTWYRKEEQTQSQQPTQQPQGVQPMSTPYQPASSAPPVDDSEIPF